MSVPTGRYTATHLHPLVYRVMVALAVWLVLSVWWLFDGPGYIQLVLAVVTGLILVSVMIPYALSRASRHNRQIEGIGAPDRPPESFAAWLRGTFDTWTGPCPAATAAVEVLLPIAAVALGMTAFGIVLAIARAG